ncbi:MAG: DUF302 domain-containing protein [Thiovulaceae bacterium]|nr:DUF302 domain-containing protein [Sulfurimonadaceae bacterium]
MIKKIVLVMLLVTTNILAQGDIKIFTVANNPKSDLPNVIEKRLEADGFQISANSEMNGPFTIQFKQSDYDVFHLLTVFHLKLSEALVKKYPDAGIFIPMGIGIYQAKGDKSLHVSVLTAAAQTKILGLKTVDPILTSIEKAVTASLKKAMPKATAAVSDENPLPAEGPLVSRVEMSVDADDWADTREELEMTIENNFRPMGFVMSNYTDYNYMLTQEGEVDSPFDFYDTYSVCKLKVIYNVSKTRPEAAAFAPCTLMVYKKKGDDKIVMGFPGVYNWMSSARVEDKKAREVLMKAQKDFEKILRGATE